MEYGFSVDCDSFSYDPLMGDAEVSGLRVGVPFGALSQREQVLFETRLSSGRHYYNLRPEMVYVAAGRARFQAGPGGSTQADFVMHGVTLSPASREDGDLYLTADELTLTPDSRVVLSGITLHISGVGLGKWPQLSRRLEPRPGLFGFSLPHVSYDKDSGMLVRQQVDVDLKALKLDSLLDYSTAYGLRAHTYSYIQPMPGAQLGVAYGSRSLMDIRRESFALTEDYNVIARQRFKLHGPLIDDGWYSLEYGHMSLLPEEARGVSAVGKVEDTRQAASGT